MPLTAQDIFNLPDRQRRSLHFVPVRRGKYRKEIRPKRSPDELVAYLRDNNIRSTRQLERRRRDGDPVLSDYRSAFVKWSDALFLAFGRPDEVMACNDPEYMAKILVQFEVKTISHYKELRRKRPDIVPSYWEVRRKWGGFKGLKLLLRRYSMKAIFDAYLSLRRRMGRRPTIGECKAHGIHFDTVIDLFGSKKKLYAFLEELEKKR